MKNKIGIEIDNDNYRYYKNIKMIYNFFMLDICDKKLDFEYQNVLLKVKKYEK